MVDTSHPGDSTPTADEVRAELQRVLAGPSLRGAPQMSAFLAYVVEETLAGRGGNLKGYNVAVEALGRGPDFDPVADPIVRVEANRLRRALDTHYAGAGAKSPLRIVLERGSYAARFVRVQPETAVTEGTSGEAQADGAGANVADAGSAAGQKTDFSTPQPMASWQQGRGWLGAALVLILGIGVGTVSLRLMQPPQPPPALTSTQGLREPAGNRAAPMSQPAVSPEPVLAETLLPSVRVVSVPSSNAREQAANAQFALVLADALSRFDEFVVIEDLAAAGAAPGQPLQPVGRPASHQPAYMVEIRAREAGANLLADLRLVDAGTGRVVWSASLEDDGLTLDTTYEIREAARRAAVRLAQPYGVLHAELRERTDLGPELRCLIGTHDYWRKPTEKRHAKMRACLEAAVREHPNFHQAWSLLAMLTLDEHRIGFNPRPDPPLVRARAAARTANELAPESARAAQALMAVTTVEGDAEAGVRSGFQAVRRNPFDTDILADLGARLAQAGRPLEGRPLLLRAADVNAARPAWHDFYLYLTARFAGDRDGMRDALRSLAGSDAPLALLAQIIAASDAGKFAEGRMFSQRLASISPVYASNPADFLDRARFAPGVRADLMEAINQLWDSENALTAPASLP